MSERYIIIQISPESFSGVEFSRDNFRSFVSYMRAALLHGWRQRGVMDLKFTLVERARGPIEVTLSSTQGLPSVLAIYDDVNLCLEEFLSHAKNPQFTSGEFYAEILH